jgi:hypothetical protein
MDHSLIIGIAAAIGAVLGLLALIYEAINSSTH